MHLVAEHRPCQFHVVMNDVRSNNWNILFNNVENLPNSFLYNSEERKRRYGVFVSASATSFYHQVVPDCSVDFAFSFTAQHWLSSLPCQVKGHITSRFGTNEEKEAFYRHSMQDWDNWITLRVSSKSSPSTSKLDSLFSHVVSFDSQRN